MELKLQHERVRLNHCVQLESYKHNGWDKVKADSLEMNLGSLKDIMLD